MRTRFSGEVNEYFRPSYREISTSLLALPPTLAPGRLSLAHSYFRAFLLRVICFRRRVNYGNNQLILERVA